jgi:hypothetical protein
MYGDTATMRKRAAQLREQGSDVRALADRLVAQLEGLRWEGRAAADLRSRIHDRAGHLRDCAGQHENAAEALEKHLDECDRLKDAISGTERARRPRWSPTPAPASPRSAATRTPPASPANPPTPTACSTSSCPRSRATRTG